MRAKRITADSRWQTYCIYGASGVGKTTVAASAPRPYFCDSNQGLLSIADAPGLEHVRGDDVKSMKDLDEVYDNMHGTGDKDWSKKFDTVVFDHFDDIQGIILDALADKAAEKDDRREVDQLEQREYGIMGNKLRRYLRKFKRLPKHKILICSESTDFDTGRLKPHLLGAMKTQLPYFCDHIIYFRIGKKGRRYLHLNSTDSFYAKTRARWIPREDRTILVKEDDTEALTRLFATIAAGPKKYNQKRRTKETE